MAGIFGVQYWEGRGVDRPRSVEQDAEALLHAARQGFDHPGKSHCFTTSVDRPRSMIGAAIPHFYSDTAWPLLTRDGNYALAIFGEVYLPSGQPLRETNFEEQFIRPFLETVDPSRTRDRRSPAHFLCTLDGAFSIALMSATECWLANDPFGNFALHYSTIDRGRSTQSRFVFASQAEGIRNILNDRSIDETGMFQNLGLGLTLAGQTMFSPISRLAGGTLLMASANGIRKEKYFKPRYAANSHDLNESLDRIRAEFEGSVLRRAQYRNADQPRSVVAALSGGFDSRVTWSILLKNEIPIVSHTHGLPNCSDLAIAGRIARAFHIPRDTVPYDEAVLAAIPRQWNEIVRLTEGVFSISQAPTLLAWKELGKRFSVLLDSYGGTFYRRQRMKVAERMIDSRKDLVPQLLRFERSPLLRMSGHPSMFLKPDAARAAETAASQGLRAYYDSISNVEHLGDKLDLFHFEQVDVMRDSLLSNAQMNFIGLAHPFLALPAIEIAMTLPLAERRRDAAHKYILHASFPKLERFWMDNVGFVTPYRGFSQLRYGAMAIEHGLRKASSTMLAARFSPGLLGHLTLRRPTMDMEHLLLPGIAHAKEILLTPHSLFDTLFDRLAIERGLHSFEAGGFEVGNAIAQLLTFRLFLDLFF